jgi:hypothetical protein
MKVMSKSPSRLLVGLQEKFKLTGKYIYIFVSFYYIFQYSNILADFGD